MSRKTKKQKILARLHREKTFFRTPFGSPSPQNPPSPVASSHLVQTETVEANKQPPSLPSQTPSLYIYPLHLIKKDLTKTIFLSILALSLEVALYFLLEKNLILPSKLK